MATFTYTPKNGTKVELNTSRTFTVQINGVSGVGASVNLYLCDAYGTILRRLEISSTSTTASVTAKPATMGQAWESGGEPAYVTWGGWFYALNGDFDIYELENIPQYPVVTYNKCTAPTSVSVTSTKVKPGASVRLSWSGAGTGADSGISAYKVYRATSATGTYSLLATVSSTATSGSTTVVAPTTAGSSYYYKVQTISAVSGKDSSMSTVYASLTAINPTACGAPTDCMVDSTLSLVATTLRWSGATSGVDNNISRYEIQRRSRTHKGEWGAWSAFEITSGKSLSVSPPVSAGHYYQYRVRAQGTAGEAYYSGWKESTNTLRKAHQTVPEFTDPTLIVGLTDVKAVHITELQEALNNILLPFMDENKIAFIAIDKDSDAKHWGDHVQELKSAIDSTGVSHDSWVVMQGEVTADVIDQIRRIVRSM